MKPLPLNVFTGKDLQNLAQLLLVAERAGYDVRPIRTALENYHHSVRLGNRRNRNKPAPKASKKPFRPKPRETTIKQSNIECPDCHKGYLQVKKLDGVTYTACPQCYKSVEFR